MGIFEGAANAIQKIGKGKPKKPEQKNTTKFAENLHRDEATGNYIAQAIDAPNDDEISHMQGTVRSSISKVIEQEKLLKKLEQSYDEMKETLTAFGFTEVPPSKKQVMDAIAALDPSKLEQILQFGKPTILITPPGDFASKIKAIDDHKKIPGQINTWCTPDSSDQLWGSGSAKMVVTVVDGVEAMPQPPFITNKLNIDQKMNKYEKDFANQKLDMMSCQEGAMLMMQSLKLSQPIDDLRKNNSATFYSREELPNGSDVPYSFWDSSLLDVNFDSDDPDNKRGGLRCRPSVKVLEI